MTTESLRVVPAVSLTLEPEQFIIPEGRNAQESAKPLDVLLRAHSYSDAAAQITVGLDVPSGWKISAPQNVQLEAGGDALQRFVVIPPAGLAAGTFELKAWAKRGAQEFRESLAPLPSLPSYLWTKPATLPVHAFAIDVPANLHVGYIAADIDPVPAALGRVGVQVDMIDPATLAFGDCVASMRSSWASARTNFAAMFLRTIIACSTTSRQAALCLWNTSAQIFGTI